MIRIAIRPEIIKYCYKEKNKNITDMDSFPVEQFIQLRRKTDTANKEMINYLDKIRILSGYLIDVLNILSELSKETVLPVDELYFNDINENDINENNSVIEINLTGLKALKSQEQNIYNEVSLLVYKFKEKNNDLMSVSLKNKCDVILLEYNTIIKEFKAIYTAKYENNERYDFNDFLDVLKDFYIKARIEWTKSFYNEFKIYCNINNKNYYFVLDNNISEYFGPTLIDAGDKEQKEKLDNLINEFEILLNDLENIAIDPKVKRNSKTFINNENCLLNLYKEYNELENLFNILKLTDNNGINENIENYITVNNNILKWNDHKVLLAAIIIHVLGKKVIKYNKNEKKSISVNKWEIINTAFDINLIDDARQYIKKPSKKIKKKLKTLLNSIKQTCVENKIMNKYNELIEKIKENTL